ncbi:hypothetical protein C7N43_27575 [Sphingobacteriales bacterium UPWRP_1]|nr:hypothetical protein BVG80_09100 [Sphingobacteriales bacterium TSM_CSM]PSJ73729.1 hypothetical protein C7N43_27575 [Sphingobacteriales bacterium UPWRP_1]
MEPAQAPGGGNTGLFAMICRQSTTFLPKSLPLQATKPLILNAQLPVCVYSTSKALNKCGKHGFENLIFNRQ